jgi:hypothetical protein
MLKANAYRSVAANGSVPIILLEARGIFTHAVAVPIFAATKSVDTGSGT